MQRHLSGGRNPDGIPASSRLRPLSCELPCTIRADGSALWKSGSTHVLAAVYAPVALRMQTQEPCDEAPVSVVIKSGEHRNSTYSPAATAIAGSAASKESTNSKTCGLELLEREWEQLLTAVLSACTDTQAHSRTAVHLVLQVIQDDGSVMAAALHSAVAALFDAGVPMHKVPVATTFLVVEPKEHADNHDGGINANQLHRQQRPNRRSIRSLLLHPKCHEELEPNSSVFVIVTENEYPDRILATHSVGASSLSSSKDNVGGGALSIPTIVSCAQAAAKSTPVVVSFWRLAMEQRFTRVPLSWCSSTSA